MRRALRSLVAVAFSLASLSSAATLDFSDVFESGRARGNHERIRYSGNADFGTVDLSQWADDRDNGRGRPDWLSERGAGENRGRRDSDRSEVLEVSFERPLFITSIDVSRLANGPIMMHIAGAGGGFDVLFDASNRNISVNQFASSISFVPTAGILSDFSRARITIDETLHSLHGTSSPIPEPSSVVMLLIGGALVATQLRRLV